jgi:hypothetical protein
MSWLAALAVPVISGLVKSIFADDEEERMKVDPDSQARRIASLLEKPKVPTRAERMRSGLSRTDYGRFKTGPGQTPRAVPALKGEMGSPTTAFWARIMQNAYDAAKETGIK